MEDRGGGGWRLAEPGSFLAEGRVAATTRVSGVHTKAGRLGFS